MLDKFSAIVMTLWVGALWAIGYIAAPVLFHSLPSDKMLAGNLAGALFTVVAYIGMVSAIFLMVSQLLKQHIDALKTASFWIVLAMLVLTMLSYFGINPIIAQLKAQALPHDVMQSVFASRFKTWHGVASIAYLIQSLLGLALVWKSR